jgi:hypothetical protein
MLWNAPDAENSNLLGYNIYRNNIQINTEIVTDTIYYDIDLDDGIYQYYITAVFPDEESYPSNIIEVLVEYISILSL